MPNNYTFFQAESGATVSFIKGKIIPFLKQSFIVPFIFATILYILMRVFFIGAEFELLESVELYVKTLVVTWAYFNAFRLICLGIVWLESKATKVKVASVINMQLLKKTAIVILVAGLTYSVKARSTNMNHKATMIQDVAKAVETGNEIEPKFYFWMK